MAERRQIGFAIAVLCLYIGVGLICTVIVQTYRYPSLSLTSPKWETLASACLISVFGLTCLLFALVFYNLRASRRYHFAVWLSYILVIAFFPFGAMIGTRLRENDYYEVRSHMTAVVEQISSFANSNGRYPESLDELGPGALAGIRDLGEAGMVQYRLTSSGYPRLQYKTWEGWLFYDFRNDRWQSD